MGRRKSYTLNNHRLALAKARATIENEPVWALIVAPGRVDGDDVIYSADHYSYQLQGLTDVIEDGDEQAVRLTIGLLRGIADDIEGRLYGTDEEDTSDEDPGKWDAFDPDKPKDHDDPQ